MTSATTSTGHHVTANDQIPEILHDDTTAAEAAASNPALIGVPSFVVGTFALALVQTGYVSAPAVGASLAIIMMATGIGQLIAAVWAISLGQGPVASIFAIFGGFWLSYPALVLGLTHDWFAIPADQVVKTQGLFLISWLAIIVVLTLVTLRLPLAFTILFVLVDVALAFVLTGTLQGSSSLVNIGGYFAFAFALVGVYLFADAMGQATGGKPLPLGTPVLH